ncbi:uncharacterized protein LOC129800288 [Phlebotomus papatasi]|uniref:uncharacterized protein LOC129800288 n=1 Tax=Phlebotomus papatasi TaxID=29031 RepID=UPI002483861D|nr:uncharacterized protein LOC129800288 [Phlebotomus papatasi]
MVRSFQLRILYMEIKVTYWEIGQIKLSLMNLQQRLRTTEIASVNGFLLVQDQVFWREFRRSTSNQQEKFNALFLRQLGHVTNMPSADWVVNKTDVPIPHEDYENKMLNIVSDESTYKKIPMSKTITTENKNNALVKKLYDRGHIDPITRRQLTTHNSRTPRIYGLPKIHKPDTPLRPIASCIKSPTYSLSKFLIHILRQATNLGGYSVKDSYEFVDRVCNTEVPEGYIMISLDVVSLFPNIPRQLAMEIVDELWNSNKINTDISKDLFEQMLRLCLETSYFTYNDQHYVQIDGMPMGGPLSPVIADIVMDHVLINITQRIPFQIVCLTKYVDDLFCLIPHDKSDEVLSYFNNYHEKLQFTIEKEVDGAIPYLDTYVVRQESCMRTMWYKKPIASDRMLNYHSNHPLQQKVSTAIGLINRVLKLTTANTDNTKNIIITKLKMNGFPTRLINALWNTHNNNTNHNTTREDTNPNDVTYRSIMYIPTLRKQKILSTVVKEELIKCMSKENVINRITGERNEITRLGGQRSHVTE